MAVFGQFPQQVLPDEPGGAGEREQHPQTSFFSADRERYRRSALGVLWLRDNVLAAVSAGA